MCFGIVGVGPFRFPFFFVENIQPLITHKLSEALLEKVITKTFGFSAVFGYTQPAKFFEHVEGIPI